MPKPRPLIAGNWKMNGLSADGWTLADEIVRAAPQSGPNKGGPELLVCPPFTLIGLIAEAVANSSVALGAQDCHPQDSGAHTGDVSAPMLADLGCRYVIVGHSERRTNHQESSAQVKAKAAAAQKAGLSAIVCVGETWAEREAGKTAAIVGGQVAESIPAGSSAATLVVAYEPVWAIGSGRTATPEQIAEVHALIRQQLGGQMGSGSEAVRILYGGSVKPANAREILAIANVDGALVGGASLKSADFLGIAAGVP